MQPTIQVSASLLSNNHDKIFNLYKDYSDYLSFAPRFDDEIPDEGEENGDLSGVVDPETVVKTISIDNEKKSDNCVQQNNTQTNSNAQILDHQIRILDNINKASPILVSQLIKLEKEQAIVARSRSAIFTTNEGVKQVKTSGLRTLNSRVLAIRGRSSPKFIL